MKKVFLLGILCVFVGKAFAQKETFDLVTYTPPTGWEKAGSETKTSYTIVNKDDNTWCQIHIIKSTNSRGSIEQDFDSEWQELIVKNYKPIGTAQLYDVQEAAGWKIKSGTTKFSFDSVDAIANLITISGFDRCVSIVATTNSENHIKDIGALLSSLELQKPETDVQAPASNTNSSVVGTWGISTVISSSTNFRRTEGTIVKQYTFNANGTYSFYIKTFRYQLSNLLLTRETGVYQISGNTITVSPQKSVIESWSKKNGTDDWGVLISSQKKELEKATYQFSTRNLISGMGLVLKAGKLTKRDGPFNNSDNDAWLYPSKSSSEFIKLPNGK